MKGRQLAFETTVIDDVVARGKDGAADGIAWHYDCHADAEILAALLLDELRASFVVAG